MDLLEFLDCILTNRFCLVYELPEFRDLEPSRNLCFIVDTAHPNALLEFTSEPYKTDRYVLKSWSGNIDRILKPSSGRLEVIR